MHKQLARFRALSSTAALLGFLAAGPLLALPAAGEDRTHVVEWTQPDGPAVEGFVVELGTQPGAYTTSMDLGPVAPQQDGVWRTNLALDAFTTYHFRLIAYNAAGESPPSEAGTAPALICYPGFCDDGNECTADACDADGCANVPLADGTGCFDGMCVAGRCEPIQCLADAACDDGNRCNGQEFCAADGMCGAGLALSCGEPSACAAPSCDPSLGCVAVPLPDGTECNDGDKRTRADRCQAGVCVGTAKTTGRGRGRKR